VVEIIAQIESGLKSLSDDLIYDHVSAGHVVGAKHRDILAWHAEIGDVQRYGCGAPLASRPIAVAHGCSLLTGFMEIFKPPGLA